MISDAQFAAMKPAAVVMNVGRDQSLTRRQ